MFPFPLPAVPDEGKLPPDHNSDNLHARTMGIYSMQWTAPMRLQKQRRRVSEERLRRRRRRDGLLTFHSEEFCSRKLEADGSIMSIIFGSTNAVFCLVNLKVLLHAAIGTPTGCDHRLAGTPPGKKQSPQGLFTANAIFPDSKMASEPPRPRGTWSLRQVSTIVPVTARSVSIRTRNGARPTSIRRLDNQNWDPRSAPHSVCQK